MEEKAYHYLTRSQIILKKIKYSHKSTLSKNIENQFIITINNAIDIYDILNDLTNILLCYDIIEEYFIFFKLFLELSVLYIKIAKLYETYQKYTLAITYYNKAITTSITYGFFDIIIECYCNIGNIYYNINNDSINAIKYYNFAIDYINIDVNYSKTNISKINNIINNITQFINP